MAASDVQFDGRLLSSKFHYHDFLAIRSMSRRRIGINSGGCSAMVSQTSVFNSSRAT